MNRPQTKNAISKAMLESVRIPNCFGFPVIYLFYSFVMQLKNLNLIKLLGFSLFEVMSLGPFVLVRI